MLVQEEQVLLALKATRAYFAQSAWETRKKGSSQEVLHIVAKSAQNRQ